MNRSTIAPYQTGSDLLAMFREFHFELVGIKEALAMGDRLAAQGESTDPEVVATRVHARLRRLLDRQAAEVARSGGSFALGRYREAQFAMAALADETLLHGITWDGRAFWNDLLLESVLFGSQIAGEVIFDRIADIVALRGGVDVELATIYLTILSLGFRGRYWRPQDDAHLATIRLALARQVAQDGSFRQEGSAGVLCPAAYATTLAGGKAARLPHLRPYFIGLGVGVLIYLLASHVIWIRGTESLRELTGIAPVTVTGWQAG
jgi:type VI secretion system protein ImpK